MSCPQKKVVVIGDGSCGKTCLLSVYITQKFPIEYIPTVFDIHSKEMTLDDGTSFTMTLLDTSGQEDYERLRDLQYVNTDVFVVCFEVDSRSSFQNVRSKWMKEIKCFKLPLVLVGTKSDLRQDVEGCVTKEEAEALAKKIKAVKYVECSAKRNERVQEVFDLAAKSAWYGGNKPNDNKTKRCMVL